MLRFVIYGIGHRGKLLLEWFDKKYMAAIIDRNSEAFELAFRCVG